MAAISDLSGPDIAVHNGDTQRIVAELRNWLNNQASLRAPGPTSIWGAFLDFMADNYDTLKRRGFSDRDIEKLPVDELMQGIDSWVGRKRIAAPRRRLKKR